MPRRCTSSPRMSASKSLGRNWEWMSHVHLKAPSNHATSNQEPSIYKQCNHMQLQKQLQTQMVTDGHRMSQSAENVTSCCQNRIEVRSFFEFNIFDLRQPWSTIERHHSTGNPQIFRSPQDPPAFEKLPFCFTSPEVTWWICL